MNEESISTDELLKEELPSLDLSFDWVKGVLDDQSATANVLDTKALTLFSVATAVLGISVTFGIPSLASAATLRMTFAATALGAYILVVYYSVRAVWVREFATVDDPATIREDYWYMPTKQFKLEILAWIERIYEENKTQLDKKGQAAKYLVPSVAVEVICLVLALWLGS